jgi:hypothetical protein
VNTARSLDSNALNGWTTVSTQPDRMWRKLRHDKRICLQRSKKSRTNLRKFWQPMRYTWHIYAKASTETSTRISIMGESRTLWPFIFLQLSRTFTAIRTCQTLLIPTCTRTVLMDTRFENIAGVVPQWHRVDL